MSADLHQYLAQALGSPSLRLAERPPLEHQSNRLYDAWHGARHLIVKEYLRTDKVAVAPLREYRALERLRPFDLAPAPVACLMEHDLEGVGPLVVYEYMAGEMWDRQARSPNDLAALAETWRLTNTLPPEEVWAAYNVTLQTLRAYVLRFADTFHDYAAWAALEHPAGCALAEQCLHQLQRGMEAVAHLEASPPVLCFCRSDPRFANVIARPGGRLGLVDWEDCGLRDPACDVADLLVHANQEDLVTPELWQVFLDHYVPTRTAVDPGFTPRVQAWRMLFHLRWLQKNCVVGLERARSGRLAGWRINGQPPNWRLRRYLARALAWPKSDFAAELEAVQDLGFFPGVD